MSLWLAFRTPAQRPMEIDTAVYNQTNAIGTVEFIDGTATNGQR